MQWEVAQACANKLPLGLFGGLDEVRLTQIQFEAALAATEALAIIYELKGYESFGFEGEVGDSLKQLIV